MLDLILLVFFALSIGLLLGLLGGGGSILTVPVLVFWLGFEAKQAIVTSLIIVAITSTIAMLMYARRQLVCWKTGFAFSVTGVIGAYTGGRVSGVIPNEILLILFAAVMLITAVAMLRNQRTPQVPPSEGHVSCPGKLPFASILFDGLMVGFITGLVGVGGGFLLVPALNFLVKLPMHSAIGTSLMIITLQSISALIGHADHFSFDAHTVMIFTLYTVIGSVVGSMLSRRVHPRRLKKSFGVFVLIIGLWMLVKDINPETIAVVQTLYEAHQEFVLGAATALLAYLIYKFRIWLHRRNI